MSQAIPVFQESLFGLWESIVGYMPNLFGAIIVFFAGVAIAVVMRKIVVRGIALLKIDEAIDKFEVKASLEKFGIKLHVGELIGWIFKWFFIIVALIAATDILGWYQVTDYLKQVVIFVPNVIIAIIILLAGILLGNFVRNIVKSAVNAARLASADFLAGIAKWSILVFSFMAAMVQLNIAPDLIRVLFTGLVAMMALAGGLAFGLGGKDHASRLLDQLRRDMSSSDSSESPKQDS